LANDAKLRNPYGVASYDKAAGPFFFRSLGFARRVAKSGVMRLRLYLKVKNLDLSSKTCLSSGVINHATTSSLEKLNGHDMQSDQMVVGLYSVCGLDIHAAFFARPSVPAFSQINETLANGDTSSSSADQPVATTDILMQTQCECRLSTS
jgi:hypothetical protein